MVMMTRWNPMREMLRMQGRLNRLMDDTWSGQEGDIEYGNWAPAVDLREDETQFVIQVDLPGVDKKNIDIHVENNVLTLSGERRFEKEDERQNYHRIERAYGKFVRSFTLPSTVRSGDIAANYQDGILEVVLPKAEESKPKKIAIK